MNKTIPQIQQQIKEKIKLRDSLQEALNESKLQINELKEEIIFLEKGYKVGYVVQNKSGNVGLITSLTNIEDTYAGQQCRKISKKTGKLHKYNTYFVTYNDYEVLAESYDQYLKDNNLSKVFAETRANY